MNSRITVHPNRKAHPDDIHRLFSPSSRHTTSGGIPSSARFGACGGIGGVCLRQFPSSRIRPFFVGGSLPASRCHCRMAAANTVLPAAKSAKEASSRRRMPQPRAVYACSRRQ